MDKRRLKRRQLIYYLKVVDRRTGSPVGRLVDITTEGFMLVSSVPVAPGQQFELRLDLPEAFGPRKEVSFEAESRWTGQDINPDFSDSGFSFISIAPEDVQLISDLIDEYELPGTV